MTRQDDQPPTVWTVGGASIRGAAHQRRNTPNQDAIAWQAPEGGAARLIAAVSDGHGAAAHFRSGDGAQLAVQAASIVLDEFLNSDRSAAAATALPRRVVTAWQKAVREHAATTAAEGDWIEPLDDTLTPYGATLVAVGVGSGLAVTLQIGDGDLYLGFADGRIVRPLPDDEGLVGEQTHSLCEPGAIAHVRVATLDIGPASAAPDFIMLSTDGVSKSFADEGALRAVAQHYRGALKAAEPGGVFEQLPTWLETVSRMGSGDDVTLCLGVCR